MHILVLILGTVLLPAAYALKCYECIPALLGSCTETTKDCPSNTQCGSLRTISYTGGSKSDVKIKTCVGAEQCFNGSLNLGYLQTVITTTCCTSDLCNSQDAPAGSISSPNGKKCFQCEGNNCNKTLSCNGNEDYCISVAVTSGDVTLKLKGCASKMICSNTQNPEITGITGAKISCCQGDLCNSSSSSTASLLLFVTSLILLGLFS
ncbi:ly6/PLAUR domain-containing protein 2 [Haplochromis burtoni]|uniref:Ly6/PLAUR domain-containing protein 2-like n=1 Tax=Haplochromis burtoni TaxID=8153 RepID=A0A3Q2VYT3_HAPBU|nr:ly6/PLAUR domain-containing protein 2 [Haplochromis burtoni]